MKLKNRTLSTVVVNMNCVNFIYVVVVLTAKKNLLCTCVGAQKILYKRERKREDLAKRRI